MLAFSGVILKYWLIMTQLTHNVTIPEYTVDITIYKTLGRSTCHGHELKDEYYPLYLSLLI